MIGHTQPRRLAARSVADRIAAELGQKVGRAPGQVVGYQVRFTDEVGPTTLVKLMTDGILLAEIQSDPMLRRYDTLIIDEAHERSLNIDFILGYLARLLPMRPDLKVIITSATIDSQRFAAHFGRWQGTPGRGTLIEAAPVIEVSGRTYPVEIRYRPLSADLPTSYTSSSTPEPGSPPAEDGGTPAGESPSTGSTGSAGAEQLVLEDPDDDLPTLGYGLGEDIDVEQAICHAVDELISEDSAKRTGPELGDILVFLPGERDIRDTEQALLDHLGPRGVRAGQDAGAKPGDVEIVPLFARLTAAEQHRIFEPHRLRRVVLATNVAETSLTVPGIRYVIDPGMARISRYSNRTKVQRLPIEPVSQASANQRAGRCGRVADGIAIRLYSQRDYEARPAFTEPEILRTSLASVILQMASLGLGSVGDFPFLDAPDRRAIRDGVQLLVEIGALEEDTPRGQSSGTRQHSATSGPHNSTSGPHAGGYRLTPIGRDLARLPIDPRLGRMLLEADANGCASEVLVIVAALSIQDVRERPLEYQGAADAAHARLADPHSDFITYLNLWRYLHVQQRDLSGSAFRRLCRNEFLHYLRFREWRDVVGQLKQMARPLDLKLHDISGPSSGDVIEAARFGGVQDAAARAVVAHTAGANSVDANEIHRSLLVGLLSNLGSWDEAKREYQGARGTRFTIWPGSGLAHSHPAWVMTAELVETSRLFARTVARIRPEWIEPLAGGLLKRVYSEPYWSTSKGAAMVKEKVLLYGMTLVADRPVLLGRLGDLVLDDRVGFGSGGSAGAGAGVGGIRGALGTQSVAKPGSLAGLAQGLLGYTADSGASRHIGSVGRDILAMALADELSGSSESVGAPQPAGPSSAEVPAKTDTVVRAGEGPQISKFRLTRENTESDSAEQVGKPTTVSNSAGDPQDPGTQASGDVLTARSLAREMFIQNALVSGNWRERHPFQKKNAELLEQAREVERRSRTHGLVADEQALHRFFDDLIPDDIVSTGHFNRWWKRAQRDNPDLLTYTQELLLPRSINQDQQGFPDSWESGDLRLPLEYQFSPGSNRDGVTMTIPIEVLERVSDEGTDWLVPGMLEELITETIRALPKAKRRLLAPAPEVGSQAARWIRTALESGLAPAAQTPSEPVDEVDPMSLSAAMDRLSRWGAATGTNRTQKSHQNKKPATPSSPPQSGQSTSPAATPAAAPSAVAAATSTSAAAALDWSKKRPSFATAFTHAIREIRGVDVSAADLAYSEENLPAHLRMTFVVVDRSGRELGSGEDLVYLQKTLSGQADNAIRRAVRGAVAEAFADASQNRGHGKNRSKDRSEGRSKNGSREATSADRQTQNTRKNRHSRGQNSPDSTQNRRSVFGSADDCVQNSGLEQSHSHPNLHLDDLTDFPQSLPRSIESSASTSAASQALTLRGFPTLVPQGTPESPKAGVRVMANAAEADRQHREGLARLLVLKIRLQQTRITTRWTGRQALMLAASPYKDTGALVADAQLASALSLVDELTQHPGSTGAAGPSSIRTPEAFADLVGRARNLHEDRVYEILGAVVRAMEAAAEVDNASRAHQAASLAEVVADVNANTRALNFPGFVSATPLGSLPHVARYLRAGAVRLQKAASSAGALDRDLQDMERIHEVEAVLTQARKMADSRPFDARRAAELEQARWMLQELRVSMFAQQLGTPLKVSVKRILGVIGPEAVPASTSQNPGRQ
nr:DUF3418 domain-containing protein [Schaalia vaccimaxillae]